MTVASLHSATRGSPAVRPIAYRTGGRTSSWAWFGSSLPAFLLLGALVPLAASAATGGRTIGLVLTVWDSAFRETPGGNEECPQGLQFSEKEQWLATPAAVRDAQNHRFGFRWNRGPNGENGITAPVGVTDPLPFREVRAKLGFGFDLDGTRDGAATAKTCAHEKFRSPDGSGPVDHQMYRVLGCAQGMRKGGFQREWVGREFQTSPSNRILIEVAGVDDEKNDDDVRLTFYKGYDRLVEVVDPGSGQLRFLPHSTQRIDERNPNLSFSTRGRIVRGVLTTEPVPAARFPLLWIQIVGVRTIRDMRLRLELNDQGAVGLVGGYEDVDEHWQMWRRGASGSQDISSWSGASIYKALRRLADGYRSATGECTAISVAYRVEAVRANIVHARGPRDTSEHPALHELRGY